MTFAFLEIRISYSIKPMNSVQLLSVNVENRTYLLCHRNLEYPQQFT